PPSWKSNALHHRASPIVLVPSNSCSDNHRFEGRWAGSFTRHSSPYGSMTTCPGATARGWNPDSSRDKYDRSKASRTLFAPDSRAGRWAESVSRGARSPREVRSPSKSARNCWEIRSASRCQGSSCRPGIDARSQLRSISTGRASSSCAPRDINHPTRPKDYKSPSVSSSDRDVTATLPPRGRVMRTARAGRVARAANEELWSTHEPSRVGRYHRNRARGFGTWQRGASGPDSIQRHLSGVAIAPCAGPRVPRLQPWLYGRKLRSVRGVLSQA